VLVVSFVVLSLRVVFHGRNQLFRFVIRFIAISVFK